jgi:hypothetical protein
MEPVQIMPCFDLKKGRVVRGYLQAWNLLRIQTEVMKTFLVVLA